MPLRLAIDRGDRYPGWSGNLFRPVGWFSRRCAPGSKACRRGTWRLKGKTIPQSGRGQGCGARGPMAISTCSNRFAQMNRPVATPWAGPLPPALWSTDDRGGGPGDAGAAIVLIQAIGDCFLAAPGSATRAGAGPAPELKENQREIQEPRCPLVQPPTTASRSALFFARPCRCP